MTDALAHDNRCRPPEELNLSRIDKRKTKPFGSLARVVIGTLAVIMLPPFVLLAVAPMLLVLTPVALIAIPFMLSAFAGEAALIAHDCYGAPVTLGHGPDRHHRHRRPHARRTFV
jgi:hypothetical protein